MVVYITKDDNDTSTFNFEDSRNGKWLKVADEQNYGGTSMLAWAIGTAVRVDFRGKSIILFGTIDQGINVTVSVDGGNPQTVFQSTDVKDYRQQLYNTSGLQYGDHTLLVTQLFDHFPLIVDYAQIDPGDNPTDPIPSSVLQTSSSTNPPSLSPGGIAGIVIAIIIILGAIIFGVLLRKRIQGRVKQILRPNPLPPPDLPLHTRSSIPDTIANSSIQEKAQLKALWQASQDHSRRRNGDSSSGLTPSSPSSSANPSSRHASSQNYSSSLPSGPPGQEQTLSSRADVDTTSSNPDTQTSSTSQSAPPVTDMTIMTGMSIPASGWSFHQRFVSNVAAIPESPTGSVNSRGTFNSSDLDHAVPVVPEPELPPYPGSMRGSTDLSSPK